MNIEKYIQRIGHKHQLSISHECLKSLHQCHVMTIPFEALDVQLNRTIKLDLESIYDKVILKNRGGFCYELNYLFYSFLTQIGFDCSMVSSRIFDNGSYGPEFDHMSIVVKLEEDWLVDIGFGDLFIEPLKIHSNQNQEDRFRTYKIQELKGEEFLLLESLKNKNDFRKKYIFNLKTRSIDAFSDQCHYKQFSPESYFVKNRICTLPTAFGRKTIMNDVFKVKFNDQVKKIKINNKTELIKILKEEFNVSIEEFMFEWMKVLKGNNRKINLLILEHSEKQRLIFDGLLQSVSDHFEWKISDKIGFENNEELTKFDVVIVDMYLREPYKNGLELCAKLKANDQDGKIKFIISHGLGGFDEIEILLDKKELQCHIWKPLNIEELYNAISIVV